MLDSSGSCAAAEPVDDNDCVQNLNGMGTFDVHYDAATELILMNCTIPYGSYAGWGWGLNMIQTEMVIFSAYGKDTSTVTTYYSTSKDDPDLDTTTQPCYTSTITDLGNNYAQFITTRPLDCGIPDSYVVKLDTELHLITGWNPDDPKLSYHENNVLEFVQLFAADGTCTF